MNTLHEQYRPQTFAEVAGQPKAVAAIQSLINRGWGGRAWWITGASGTGKTTLAWIIARHGADDFGIEEMAVGELTPAKIRELQLEHRCKAMGSKPGKVVIVNEAHGLRKDAVRLLLDVLEANKMPSHVVWIFTTTNAGQASLFEDSIDAGPLVGRCSEINLANDAASRAAFAARGKEIAEAEGIDGDDELVYAAAIQSAKGSMRALLSRIETGAFRDDARTVLEQEFAAIRSTKGPQFDARRERITAVLSTLGVMP